MGKGYSELLSSYRRMFSMIDTFHFNSRNTEKVYGEYINIPIGSQVIPITHGDVADFRKKRSYNHNVLRLGFIGSEAPYKGLPLLKGVINQLNIGGYSSQLHLDVYGGRVGRDEACPNIHYRGRFGRVDMPMVYDSIDLLVIPSIWNETFGLTSIEAMQFGVPVLVSSKVGAKDIVKKYAPQFVFDNEDELYAILFRLIKNRKELIDYNKAIISDTWDWALETHAGEIINKLY